MNSSLDLEFGLLMLFIIIVFAVLHMVYKEHGDKILSATLSEDGVFTVVHNDKTVSKWKRIDKIWYTYPMMYEAGAYWTLELDKARRYIKEHGNPYPDAHKVKLFGKSANSQTSHQSE